ncbi:M23 family metallopeptidase [Chryseobacterium chendengshani]|uniref:M23 family metallopeptidase n=1 Tax=Chryseobacterium sp. LJ668 TaxID=2864040 RepID=UPI001C689504|nr:M23 family metallopeptidase [Chryseobacterium sp. LJ668]MBW8522461.1 M23 family metallopeptidase [Chryseobacterium sp. LJ668]QYK16003.1 M23 family metallopeptidase [Chryseobacterium sp. LJ668]
MVRYKSFLALILSVLFLISCDGLKIPKNVFETSERAKYERSFLGADSLMTQWKRDFSAAAANQLKIKDGTSLIINADSLDTPAFGYSIELQKGDLLVIETETINADKKIFIDLLNQNSGSEIMKSGVIKNNLFSKQITENGWYKLVMQPEIAYSGTFKIKIYTQPSLTFPVAGKGNKNVQSFWGASRDGGGRSHEGVDIFAPRKTPVVAVADGTIVRTGNQGLGGKQVWLRDDAVGNSLYYAHLDSIITQNGKSVKAGDTLGWVGNTGNAAGGATHLHFGIYSTGGAVDPYPFIKQRAVPQMISELNKKKFDDKNLKAGKNVRSGPGTQYAILATNDLKRSVQILATDGQWYHIKTSDGLEGFVAKDQIEH